MHASQIPEDLLVKLLKGWNFLYKRGFIEGFGHISVRIPDSDLCLIARHSLGPIAHSEDFLLVNLDARLVSGNGNIPSESPIHLEIYKSRPDVSSVVHYHGLYSTAFTTSVHTLQPIHLMGTLFHDGIPVYPDPRLINNQVRGSALATTLGTHRAVLMHGHGAAITGSTIEEAASGTFLFEENARRAAISASMGSPQWLDSNIASAAGEELLHSRGPFRRVWALVESDYTEKLSAENTSSI